MVDLLLALAFLGAISALVWIERSRVLTFASGNASSAADDTRVLSSTRLLRQAGFSPESARPYFLGAKVFLAIFLPLALATLARPGWISSLVTAALGFFLPDLAVRLLRRARQHEIRRSLSYFLDLLSSLLQAGLGLEEAFRRAATDGLRKENALADEIRRLGAEFDLGRDRTEGFRALYDRTGVEDIRALANALAVGQGLGSSMESTFRSQAELARAKRREESIRRMNLASSEILLPLLLCGFPVFVVLILFPLGLQVLEAFAGLARSLR